MPEDVDPSRAVANTNSSTCQRNGEGERKEPEDSLEQGDDEFLNEEDIERFLQNEQEAASEGNLMNTSSNFKPHLGM